MAKKRKKRKAAKTTKTTVSNSTKQNNSKNNARPPKAAQRGSNTNKNGKQRQSLTHKPTPHKTAQNKSKERKNIDLTKEHPRFPFWARLRMEKWRTTLVIDEEISLNNKTNKIEDQFVHREATSPKDNEARDKKYERISPNPDKTKTEDMLLKSPRKRPKHKFEIHNKNLEMPQHLKDKYDKNNYKDKKE